MFEELSQLVQSSLDGYKVSIMSYGQTGSGKTFTMEGPTVDARNEQAGTLRAFSIPYSDSTIARHDCLWSFSDGDLDSFRFVGFEFSPPPLPHPQA